MRRLLDKKLIIAQEYVDYWSRSIPASHDLNDLGQTNEIFVGVIKLEEQSYLGTLATTYPIICDDGKILQNSKELL